MTVRAPEGTPPTPPLSESEAEALMAAFQRAIIDWWESVDDNEEEEIALQTARAALRSALLRRTP